MGKPDIPATPLRGFADHPALTATLEVAVPLRIAEYRQKGGPSGNDFARVRDQADIIAGRSDGMLYRGDRKGHAAHVFNVLADALAVMAFVPGGVRFAGVRYEATAPLTEGEPS